MKNNICMGIDASTTKTGYSLFEDSKLIDYGIIEPSVKGLEWRERIIDITSQLGVIVDQYKPYKVFVEDVPLMMNGGKKTLVILGCLQGSLLGLFSSRNIFIEFIGVSTWRSKLGLFTGKQKDTHREEMKKSSIEYANKTFGLNLIWKSPASKFNQDDISDSINVAYSQLIKDSKTFGRKIKK